MGAIAGAGDRQGLMQEAEDGRVAGAVGLHISGGGDGDVLVRRRRRGG